MRNNNSNPIRSFGCYWQPPVSPWYRSVPWIDDDAQVPATPAPLTGGPRRSPVCGEPGSKPVDVERAVTRAALHDARETLREARARVARLRIEVRERRAGAAELDAARWVEARALEAVDRLTGRFRPGRAS